MTETKSEFQSVAVQESRGEKWAVRGVGLILAAAAVGLVAGDLRTVRGAVEECESKGLTASAVYPSKVTFLSPNKRIAECSPPATTPASSPT